MCVVSMVFDHYRDKWEPYTQPPTTPWLPQKPLKPTIPQITQEEIEEFRKLLERAKKYDKDNNQPDCELDAKRKKVKELAEKLGVEIDFI